MNNREVYIVTDNDEIYLGTVGEIIGANKRSNLRFGQGMSIAAVISDFVNEIAYNDENDSRIFTIELR